MSPGTTHPVRRGFQLNCDLGEGEPPERTAALFEFVDAANVACGGHAGDDRSMGRCLELAARNSVHLGAHPGYPNREDFGRSSARGGLTVSRLEELLSAQVERLASLARDAGVVLHHVKLHGALYHDVETDRPLATAYLRIVASRWPGLRVFARAGGSVESVAQELGSEVEVWSEGFLDRGYREDGTLVPRGEPGSMLEDPALVLERLADLRGRGGCRATGGGWVALSPRTLCVHGDGPRALDLLAAVREVMPR